MGPTPLTPRPRRSRGSVRRPASPAASSRSRACRSGAAAVRPSAGRRGSGPSRPGHGRTRGRRASGRGAQGGPRYDVILGNVASHSLSDTRGAHTPQGVHLPSSAHAGMGWIIGVALTAMAVRRQRDPSSRPRPARGRGADVRIMPPCRQGTGEVRWPRHPPGGWWLVLPTATAATRTSRGATGSDASAAPRSTCVRPNGPHRSSSRSGCGRLWSVPQWPPITS